MYAKMQTAIPYNSPQRPEAVTLGREALGDRGSALGFMQRHQLWRQDVVRPGLHLVLALEDRVQPAQPGLAHVGQRVHLSYPQQCLSVFAGGASWYSLLA